MRLLETLLGWDIIGWAIALLVTVGLGVLALNEFGAAKFCFALSAIILGAKTFWWGITTNRPIKMRSLVVAAAFGLIGVAAVESFRWVDRKRTLAISPPPPPTRTGPPESGHSPARITEPPPRLPAAPRRPAEGPLVFPGFHENVATVSLSIGTIRASIPIAGLRDKTYKGAAFDIYGQIITPYLEANHLYVDVSVYRGPNLPAVQVKKGVVTVDVPGWDRNSDESAFEVVNERGIPVFQMIYLTPSDISIRGILVFKGGFTMAANETGNMFNPKDPFAFAPKPLFKYPSRLHRGEPVE